MTSNTSIHGSMPLLDLDALGWEDRFASAFVRYTGPYIAGRIACRQRTVVEVFTARGPVTASISGSLRKLGRMPVVGDFVVLLDRPEAGTAMVVDILPRKTTFVRGVPGSGTEQVIAANIDTVFIVTAAGRDLNPHRVERYLALVHASGARPVIVINKSDLAPDPTALADSIGPAAAGTPVVAISALVRSGLTGLDPYLQPGKTVALIGSSGVGKSTLINALFETTMQETLPVRAYDEKGRHSTTVRQLFVLYNGALMIDNPGLREIDVGSASEGIGETFPEILEIAAGCRFSDCRHEQEPGCAVLKAVREGTLSPDRLDSYHRLVHELTFAKKKADIGLVRFERERWRGTSVQARKIREAKEGK